MVKARPFRSLKIVLMILFASIFLMAAQCSSPFPGGNGGKNTGIDDQKFRVGTTGMEIKFLDRFPASQITNGYTSKAIIEAKNSGATNVESGLLTLFSTDRNIGITPDYLDVNLEGKQPLFNGETQTYEFSITPTDLGDGRATLVAIGCYTYETVATNELCIDPGVASIDIKDKVCSHGDISFGGGQGGPVKVDKVKVIPLVDGDRFRLRFNISVSNSGGGKIIKKSMYDGTCTGDVDADTLKDQYNIVKAIVKLPGFGVTCDSKTYEFGKRDRGHIVCESSTMAPTSAYKTPLTVVLEYGYITKELTKQVEIME